MMEQRPIYWSPSHGHGKLLAFRCHGDVLVIVQ
jgi:hypothetical protein